jgi:hypothetical protein
VGARRTRRLDERGPNVMPVLQADSGNAEP